MANSVLEIGKVLAEAHGLLAGKGRDGLFKSWVEETCGFARSSAYNYMTVYEKFEKCPTVGHLIDARALYLLAKKATPDAARTEAIERAESGERITEEVAAEIVKANKPSDAMPTSNVNTVDGKTLYRTIYADPPWKYGNQGTRAATDNHYPTLTVDEICDFEVDGRRIEYLAGENCHLHLWTTNAFLFDAKRVMEAWGFEYKSCLIWVKPQMGLGNYWRVSHELMLFGIRGKLPFADRSIPSWLESDRTKHSEKPNAIRQLVEKVSPAPRLELFGRLEFADWDVVGNQVESSLFAGK
jgi:N6-adenosine-specific RNA methylase IME4